MRRDHNIVRNTIELPNKLFCLDFEDTSKNTTTKLTDTVNGIELTKASAGSVVFEDDPDFGRCLKTNFREFANVYSANWANIYQIIFGSGQSNWAQRPFTMVFYTNCLSTNGARGGLMSIYNYIRMTGYQGYGGSTPYLASFIGGDISPTNYVGKTANTDIAMFIGGSDYANSKRIYSRLETGFTSLLEVTNTGLPYSATAGTLWFLCSQESSYYFPAGGKCAGFCIYDGLFTNEQAAYVFQNRIK